MTNDFYRLIKKNSEIISNFFTSELNIRTKLGEFESFYIFAEKEGTRKPGKDLVEELITELIDNVNAFCSLTTDGNEITLAVGSLLNIYYSEGFFEILGFFPFEKITSISGSDMEYSKLMEILLIHRCRYNRFHLFFSRDKEMQEFIEKASILVANYDYDNPINSILKFMEESCPEYSLAFLIEFIDSVINYIESPMIPDHFLERDKFLYYYNHIEKDIFLICLGIKKDTYIASKDILKPAVHLTFGNVHWGLPSIETDPLFIYRELTLSQRIRNIFGISYQGNRNTHFTVFPELIESLFSVFSETNQALVASEKVKENIIRDFSHRYKNMRATNLYDISQAFLGSDDEGLRKYGKQIFNEYLIKSDLSHEVEMLILYFKDNIDELKALINDKKTGRQNRPIGIDGSIKNATVRCLNRMMYDLKNQEMSCFTPSKEEQDALINKYTDEITLTETDCEKVLSWVEKNLSTTIKIQIADEWKLLKYNEGSYTDLIVTDILNEILYNAFKYADKRKPISLSFNYDKNANVFTILESNYFNENNVHGTMQGLSSIEMLLMKLNGDKSLFSNIEDNKFQVAIVLSGSVFFDYNIGKF